MNQVGFVINQPPPTNCKELSLSHFFVVFSYLTISAPPPLKIVGNITVQSGDIILSDVQRYAPHQIRRS